MKLIIAVGSRRVEIKKQAILEMTWNNETYNVMVFVVAGLFTSLVLGLNWLRENRIIVDCEGSQLYAKKDGENMMWKEEKKMRGHLVIPQKGEGRLGTLTAERKESIMSTQQARKHQRADERWGSIRTMGQLIACRGQPERKKS